MTETFYVLEAEAWGCVAEVYLNDIPIARRGEAEGIGAHLGRPINHLVLDGQNEVSLVVQPGATPSQAIEPRGRSAWSVLEGEAYAEVSLKRYPRRAVIGGPDGEELLSVRWDNEDDGLARVWPRSFAAAGPVETGTGRWAWEDAPELTLDEGLREEVLRVLDRLQRTLDGGNVVPFFDLSRVRLNEIERAFALVPGKKEAHIRALVERDVRNPEFVLEPIDPAQIELRLCGRRRLVEVLGRDWLPPIRQEKREGKPQTTYEVLLAELDGDLQIVR